MSQTKAKLKLSRPTKIKGNSWAIGPVQNQILWQKVVTLKYGKLSDFSGFSFPTLIKTFGLEEFVDFYRDYYPDLVRAFYYNLELRWKIVFLGQGVNKSMSTTQICSFIDLHIEGAIIYLDTHCKWEGFNNKSFYLSLRCLIEE